MGSPSSRPLGRTPRLFIEGTIGSLTQPSFGERISRARQLAAAQAAASEPLRFYGGVAAAQESIVSAHPHVLVGGRTFTASLDLDGVARALPGFLSRIVSIAPEPLRASLQEIEGDAAGWRGALERCWAARGDPRSANSAPRATNPESFLLEALLQPFAEWIAARGEEPEGDAVVRPDPASPAARCPVCEGQPVVALLREEGHGARRSAVCGFCLTEWRTGRIECLGCGENRFDALPVFRADELPAARVDACDTCRKYVKTIDLTKDGRAIGVVDDVATVALDLWAREQGYHRLRANLLRL